MCVTKYPHYISYAKQDLKAILAKLREIEQTTILYSGVLTEGLSTELMFSALRVLTRGL